MDETIQFQRFMGQSVKKHIGSQKMGDIIVILTHEITYFEYCRW